jgi:hypothetical protein
LAEPEPVELEFEYDVADSYVETRIDHEGIKHPKRWAIVINLAEDVSDPETRRRIRAAHELYMAVDGYPELERPTDSAAEFLTAIRPWMGRKRNEIAGADPEVLAAEFEGGMRDWIAQSGSPRLRLAHDRGYKVNRLYALERAAVEFPGFYVDTSEAAEWRERTDPTAEALDAEGKVVDHLARYGDSRLTCRIVWLTTPPRDLRDRLKGLPRPFRSQEALLVRRFLGRYDLLMPVDPAQQNISGGAS